MQTKEQIEQKYLHLSQIVESESTAKWQYSRQCEELSAEAKKLKQEIRDLKREDTQANLFRLVLSKSAAIVESIVRQEQQQKQKQSQPDARSSGPNTSSNIIGTATSSKPSSRFSNSPARLFRNYSHSYIRSTSETPECDSKTPRTVTRSAGLGFRPKLSPNSGSNLKQDQKSSGSELYQVEKVQSTIESTNGQISHLSRGKSIDQEQREHEIALRRARKLSSRCGSPEVGQLKGYSAVRVGQHQQRYGSLVKRAFTMASNAGYSGSIDLFGTETQSRAGDRVGTSLIQRQSISKGPETLDFKGSRVWPFTEEASATSNGAMVDSNEKPAVTGNQLKSVVKMLIDQGILISDCILEEAENSPEIQKIKKVQGFFRGWLCRRRWKQIVQEYIKSPHAESMRKRNNLIFRMVEAEEEYVGQLTLLISAFLRPFKMTASSSRPALNHDELNSIFLNSETLLFLHQIFLKGLMSRMESWPTLVLADLFNMLLPMLTIYQEYVRNHHYSLQVLAECKQREQFCYVLRRLEEKPQLNGRSLETFLTYPMHQVSK